MINTSEEQHVPHPPPPPYRNNKPRVVALIIRFILLCNLLPPDWNNWINSSNPNHPTASTSALGSIIVLPTFTLSHVREAMAIRKLVVGASRYQHDDDATAVDQQQQPQQVKFTDAYYQGGNGGRRIPLIHLPPLVLAAMEALLQLIPDGSASVVMIGILLILVDFWISRLLEIIVSLALGLSSSSSSTLCNDDKNDFNNNNNNNKNNDKINNNDIKDVDDDNDWTLTSYEQRLQANMPKLIRPKFEHVFAIIDNNQHNNEKESAVNDSSSSTSSILQQEHLPSLASNLYFCSPITMLSASPTFACFQNIRTLLLLLAIVEALKTTTRVRKSSTSSCRRGGGSISTAALSLALATYMDITFVVFVIPLTFLVYYRQQRGRCEQQQQQQKAAAAAALFIVFWISSLFCLHVMALLLLMIDNNNNNNMARNHYTYYMNIIQGTMLHALSLDKLTPSLSILWYTQMQLFQRFATYFQIIFTLLPLILIIPTFIRLYRYPFVLVANFWFVWTLFRPTGTLYDLNVAMCFMLMSPQSLARMNLVPLCLIATCALMVPVVLYVTVLYNMWLETGNGEANFLYFQCYAYNVFVAIIFIQFTGASVERDKALRLTTAIIMKEQPQQSDSSNATATENETSSKGILN